MNFLRIKRMSNRSILPIDHVCVNQRKISNRLLITFIIANKSSSILHFLNDVHCHQQYLSIIFAVICLCMDWMFLWCCWWIWHIEMTMIIVRILIDGFVGVIPCSSFFALASIFNQLAVFRLGVKYALLNDVYHC